jgi:cyclopropane fatty-acyl-phospholipid synthase-like methyltransferase
MAQIDVRPGATALVCGTGTGADSCWLADQGYDVTGVDLIQDALDIAVRMAEERRCRVRYVRDDLTDMRQAYGMFDLIVDSYCLQSIVTDRERKRVFDFVKSHLQPDGYYVIICAGYSPHKDYSASIRDKDTGIVYTLAGKEHAGLDDVKLIDGAKYLPSRRHHTMAMLVDELASYGFRIVYSTTEGDEGGLRAIAQLL